MTKKEQMPKRNKDEREKHPKDLDYNPDITAEDKEVLNNQSKDEERGEGEDDYFKDRDEPIDYAGADLDLPEMDDKKFNPTRNKADDSTRTKRPKESANTNDDVKENTETVYKGEEAEKYKSDKEKPGEDQNRRNSK